MKNVIILLLSLLVLSSCKEDQSSSLKVVSGNKIKLKLVGDVPEGSILAFDDVEIAHILPDTSSSKNPFEFDIVNIFHEEDYDRFKISPSETYIPKSFSEWVPHHIERGQIVSGWIKCLALRKNHGEKDEYLLDMPNYFAYEGVFIIKRIDSDPITLKFSRDLPIRVEVLED